MCSSDCSRCPQKNCKATFFNGASIDFLVTTERGRQLNVQIGATTQPLQRPSKRNGHFRGSFRLSLDEAQHLARASLFDNHWLDFRVGGGTEVDRTFSGCAQLISQSGVTVISDIDDTIKQSEVADRRKLLQNTFLREFEPVIGMAEVYQGWAAQGAAFHYVSSSPWQLVRVSAGVVGSCRISGRARSIFGRFVCAIPACCGCSSLVA